MATFSTSGPLVDEAQEVIATVCERLHQDLHDCGTTFAALAYYADEDSDRPALMDRGRKIRARIDDTPLKYRKLGVPDLMISLDADWWGMANRLQQEALIHHELCHRVPKVDDEGAVKRDDADRPTFEKIPHDWDHGWFERVVEDYGAASGEVEQYTAFQETRSQKWLFSDMAEEEEDEELADDADDEEILKMDQRRAAKHVRNIKVAVGR